jgi:hypothetical protein
MACLRRRDGYFSVNVGIEHQRPILLGVYTKV